MRFNGRRSESLFVITIGSVGSLSGGPASEFVGIAQEDAVSRTGVGGPVVEIENTVLVEGETTAAYTSSYLVAQRPGLLDAAASEPRQILVGRPQSR